MNQPDKLTQGDFMAAINRLTDEQWQQKATYWGENCGGVMEDSSGNPLSLGAIHMGLFMLSPKRLKQPYTYQVPGETVERFVTGLLVLEEDQINPSGEGCEPISRYLKSHSDTAEGDGYDTLDDVRADHEVVYPAGTVIIELY